jgi:hypothetical protein
MRDGREEEDIFPSKAWPKEDLWLCFGEERERNGMGRGGEGRGGETVCRPQLSADELAPKLAPSGAAHFTGPPTTTSIGFAPRNKKLTCIAFCRVVRNRKAKDVSKPFLPSPPSSHPPAGQVKVVY